MLFIRLKSKKMHTRRKSSNELLILFNDRFITIEQEIFIFLFFPHQNSPFDSDRCIFNLIFNDV